MLAGERVSGSVDLPASPAGVPLGLFAAALGLTGVAAAAHVAFNAWGGPPSVNEALWALATVVYAAVVLGYLAKLARRRDIVAAEFRDAHARNFFAAACMATMTLGGGLAVSHPELTDDIGRWLWLVGAVG